MKRLLFLAVVVSILLIAQRAQAREIAWEWNPNPPAEDVDGYRVYTRSLNSDETPAGEWVEIASVTDGEEYTGTFPDEKFEFGITAFKNFGPEEFPSVEESEKTTLVVPYLTAPTGVRIKITIEIDTP